MLISFVSAKGSPGVTTAVLAIGSEWPRTAVVIDADAAGGDLAAGLGRGHWPSASTLINLVVETHRKPVEQALRGLVCQAGGHAPLTLGGVAQVGQFDALPWSELAAGFAGITSADLLCDLGRFHPGAGVAALLSASARVVVVSRSSLPVVRATARLVPLIRERVPGPDRVSLLVINPGNPYGAEEIAANCNLDLVGRLPLDERAAAVWSQGTAPGKGWRRARLQREAKAIAERLATAREEVPR